jgi:hypothetical protein
MYISAPDSYLYTIFLKEQKSAKSTDWAHTQQLLVFTYFIHKIYAVKKILKFVNIYFPVMSAKQRVEQTWS